jgi:hypothetical protein
LLAALGAELHALVIDRDVRVHGDDGAVGRVQDFGVYLLIGLLAATRRISPVSVPARNDSVRGDSMVGEKFTCCATMPQGGLGYAQKLIKEAMRCYGI